MKLAILIADSYGEPFESIKAEVHESIWAEARNLGIPIFYCIGRRPSRVLGKVDSRIESLRYSKWWPIQYAADFILLFRFRIKCTKAKIIDNSIQVSSPETLRYLGAKVLASLATLNELGYTHVYKTTSSSILKITRLIEIIQLHPESNYGGSVIKSGSREFASGANLLLSKTAIDKLLQKKFSWNHSKLDDVAVGRLLAQRYGILDIPTLNFSSVAKVRECSQERLQRAVHYRCKSEKIPRDDIEIMRTLFLRISELEK